MAGRRKNCKRCGGPKTSGRGRRYCEVCTPLAKQEVKAERKLKERSGCEKCGDPKRPGHGQRYCQECYELQKWLYAKKATIREPRVCIECGKDWAEKNCSKCHSCRHPVRTCARCPNPVRGAYKKLCQPCYDLARAKEAAYNKEWNREHYHSKPARKLTKKQRAAKNEWRRMKYRMDHDSKPLSKETYEKNYNSHTRIPAEPLRAVIEGWVVRGGTILKLAKLSGVEEKRVREVFNGVVDTVRIGIADAVCVGAGTTLSWVYPDGNPPRPDIAI